MLNTDILIIIERKLKMVFIASSFIPCRWQQEMKEQKFDSDQQMKIRIWGRIFDTHRKLLLSLLVFYSRWGICSSVSSRCFIGRIVHAKFTKVSSATGKNSVHSQILEQINKSSVSNTSCEVAKHMQVYQQICNLYSN